MTASPNSPHSPDPRRYHDIVVGVADVKVSSGDDNVIVTYALGSCLGITLYDARRRIGGMLHAMLPDSRQHQATSQGGRIAMFIDTGMSMLLDELRKLGASERNLECKVFGGSQVLGADKFFRIGDRNVQAFQALSAERGLRVSVWEIGGQINRTIKFYLESGQVSVRTPSQPLFWR
jgi:chemotaxis protein CheD